MDKFLQLLTITGLALILTGCSSFSKEWREAARQPVRAGDLSGAWSGTWSSDFNGHKGGLRCIMKKVNDETYSARFKATYKKILSGEYIVPLTVDRDGNSFRFEGESDLGKMWGGLYTYKGAASGQTFFSTYDSAADHGKFEMKRSTLAP